jgi:hypothetical protein
VKAPQGPVAPVAPAQADGAQSVRLRGACGLHASADEQPALSAAHRRDTQLEFVTTRLVHAWSRRGSGHGSSMDVAKRQGERGVHSASGTKTCAAASPVGLTPVAPVGELKPVAPVGPASGSAKHWCAAHLAC